MSGPIVLQDFPAHDVAASGALAEFGHNLAAEVVGLVSERVRGGDARNSQGAGQGREQRYATNDPSFLFNRNGAASATPGLRRGGELKLPRSHALGRLPGAIWVIRDKPVSRARSCGRRRRV